VDHKIKTAAGQKAFVYGATGAIGSSYVQFLKYYGVYITAVCSSENRELVRSLGADKVVDYKINDFTKDDGRYDFVLDGVGKTTFMKCKKLLKKKSIFSSSNGAINLLWVLITRLLGGKKVAFRRGTTIKAGLNFIKDLVENGSFKPAIDRKYRLDKIAEAYRYVATGEKIGNVINTMDV
jgi:NADPH:quinone reductase-like Zn-dependent oxidoreductase